MNCHKKLNSIGAALLLAAATLPAMASTPLAGRDQLFHAVAATDPNATYLYDADYNITWLRSTTGANVMTFDLANSWASLNWGGLTGWHLPTAGSVYDPGLYPSTVKGIGSEAAHLYYDVLGDQPGLDHAGNPQTIVRNAGPFGGADGVPAMIWLSGTHATNSDYAYAFSFFAGINAEGPKSGLIGAMAVRNGDVLAVPEPETYAMLLGGLGLVGLVARKRR
ncbi:PEP-CTERM sorting domain-containing protein [Duganella vulcania]|uniref:PEP-CTERM sorting domain-containing protein n=1 Tax=Duganella vulcania TaxID=2692166 RepID=A0A845GQA1_9BURK|nr:PEP-CTERM sorting domain-containing protein [Duganella vulcania]MYM96713.1 PEP-CTERM sorting domain-containing protein [Duganella vulcania]